MASRLSLDNAVFAGFSSYAALVVCKTMAMSFVTAYYRITRKVFANKEDTASYKKMDLKPIFNHEEVERVRRCHQNDLENVIPFVLLGLLYTATGPDLATALWHFRVFAVARILHTLVYLGHVPQPARGLCFMVGVVVNVSMAISIFRKAGFA